MSTPSHTPIAANVLGTIGTTCWCVQLIPQLYKNWRSKSTEGLPASMMFIWIVCNPPWGVYAILQGLNVPLQLQPQVFCFLALLCWAQIFVYHHKWPWWKALLSSAVFGAACAGVEILLVLTLRDPYSRGVTWPVILIGVIATILLVAGLVPVYCEIWKRKGKVVGISFLFLLVDWSGAFFSLISLAAQRRFDILAGILYIIYLVLESGIPLSHALWLWRTSRARKSGPSLPADVEMQQRVRGEAAAATEDAESVKERERQ